MLWSASRIQRSAVCVQCGSYTVSADPRPNPALTLGSRLHDACEAHYLGRSVWPPLGRVPWHLRRTAGTLWGYAMGELATYVGKPEVWEVMLLDSGSVLRGRADLVADSLVIDWKFSMTASTRAWSPPWIQTAVYCALWAVPVVRYVRITPHGVTTYDREGDIPRLMARIDELETALTVDPAECPAPAHHRKDTLWNVIY